MAVSLPNGVVLALGTTIGADITVSAITNANPAVATATSHGLSDGDIVIFESGWSRANARVFKVDQQDANSFEVEGLNSTSTSDYPAGTGVGTVNEITAWTQISQILDVTTSGGEMQFTNYSFLENDYETSIPTQSAPMVMTMQIADDPALAGYVALKAASEARTPYALRVSYPSGAYAYYYGYVSMNETPTFTKNQIQAVSATFNLINRPTRYAA
jgi:hypothetical protein